jgi:hypothetical protein
LEAQSDIIYIGLGENKIWGGEIMIYLANAFSITILSLFDEISVHVKKANIDEIKALLKEGFKSVIGHEGTAQLFSQILKLPVKPNRQFLQVEKGDIIVVGSLNCRLPEGKVLSYEELEQFKDKIVWYIITL